MLRSRRTLWGAEVYINFVGVMQRDLDGYSERVRVHGLQKRLRRHYLLHPRVLVRREMPYQPTSGTPTVISAANWENRRVAVEASFQLIGKGVSPEFFDQLAKTTLRLAQGIFANSAEVRIRSGELPYDYVP